MSKALPAQQKPPIVPDDESSDSRSTATPIPSKYQTTPGDPGESPPPALDEDTGLEQSGTSLSDNALWRWNAFTQKQANVMRVLSQAATLRRQCLQLRNTKEALIESTMDTPTLEQLDAQIVQLDMKFLRDIAETLEAAPQVVSMIKKRLPITLARHQLDFRGGSSTNDDRDSAEFELDQDPAQAEILEHLSESNQLEETIMSLRRERSCVEEASQTGHDESSVDMADLDKKIEDATNRLKTLRAKLERLRDEATSEEHEADTI